MSTAILRAERPDGRLCWAVYREPIAELVAYELDSVSPLIQEVEAQADLGRICVGYVAYDAAPAFDPALVCNAKSHGLALAKFWVFEKPEQFDELPVCDRSTNSEALVWSPDIDRLRYEDTVRELQALIEAGDTYQVNLTFRMLAKRVNDPYRLFRAMATCRSTRYAAYIENDEYAVCSASPELFFELEGDRIVTRPMKGTAPRGRTTNEDADLFTHLAISEKDRAENLMIVDMARNDLGKIAQVGTVHTTDLFQVERYASAHQMTTTVSATTHAPLFGIFQALFPAASVTGAPKARTMQIIRDVESSPRGVYTGSIGVVGPGRRARFNVAIRTAVLDKNADKWVCGVGGGIVWDSTPEGEYDECLLKASVLASPEPFSLLETLRWCPEGGFFLLERHLDRLADSAAYFHFDLDLDRVRRTLEDSIESLPCAAHRVRLLVEPNGTSTVETRLLEPWPGDRTLTIGISRSPIDVCERFFFHKTTRRNVYESARNERPDCDEVLLWNKHGFVTEGTYSNVAYFIEGNLYTPPLTDGLLPGVLRAEMVATGKMSERSLRVEDLDAIDALYLLNSVRGLSPAQLDPNERPRQARLVVTQ